MQFSETNTKIAPALVKAWGQVESPKHNAKVSVQTKKGGQYTFEYTDHKGILDAIKQVYKENGIGVMQNASTEEMNGNLMVRVETMLLHTSGEWLKSEPLQVPCAINNMQDMGGQITYMKRYSLSAITGIATEKDDDANGASGKTYQMEQKGQQGTQKNKPQGVPSNNNKASQSQLNYVWKLIEDRVNEGYEKDKVSALLKERIEAKNDVKDFTKSEASAAITFLSKSAS